MCGWAGRILRVDLTKGTTQVESLEEAVLTTFLGGRGLNTWLLYNEAGPNVDPKGPDNKLIFGVGPVTGTPFGGGRLTITTKSPQTGFINDGNMGGFFAPQLKAAGYDAIVVQGRAPQPVWLFVDGEEISIRDAKHLWGLTTSETHQAIVREVGDRTLGVVYIGPAGENQVINSVVMGSLHHAGGRGGCGAVMGSKMLKAIAVRGRRGVKIADPDGFMSAYDEWWRALDPTECMDVFIRPWGSFGDIFVYDYISSLGGIPTRNDQDGVFEGSAKIGSYAVAQHIVRPDACSACPIPSCSHWVKHPWRTHKGVKLHAGTLIALGSNFGIDDVASIMDNHILCNELGLDIFAAFAISWAFEAYQRGLLTRKHTDGLKLVWGDPDALGAMLRKVAYRDGIGDILADGVKAASEKLGGREFALQVKGLEMTGVSPRAFLTMGLAYAVNDHGADHTRVYPPYPPLPEAVPKDLQLPFDIELAANRRIPDEKGKLVKWLFDTRAIINSLENCTYTSRGRLFTDFRIHARALSAATGVHFGYSDLLQIGERICNLERSFNVLNGRASRANDTLPDRMTREAYRSGGSAGATVPLETMLDDYYSARGWDIRTGIPTEWKLRELGLEAVVRDFEARGILRNGKES